MKKSEIVTLLNFQKSLNDTKHIKAIYKPYIFHDGTVHKYSDNYLKAIEHQYGTLTKNLIYQKDNIDKVQDICCTHPILFFVDRGYEKNYRCIFCGKNINLDDVNSLFNQEKTIKIEETATYENHYRPLNNFYEIYNYIMEMIKNNNDDDEIDFKIYFPNDLINNNLKKMILKHQ